mmetsp:Transcript_86124/g.170994  ORF Transcript_86124/g.170994 Transcript_86124/m.170994 type:complete len:200 (-) Transcript_86124:301-900(-)
MPQQTTRPSGRGRHATEIVTGRSSVARAHGLLPVTLVISALASMVAGPPLFVSSIGSVRTSRIPLITRGATAPALAPTITIPRPTVHNGIDETRYKDKVRWLMDEEDKHPPRWHVLLLDKTFESRANTITRVASCLAAVLGLSLPAAVMKAERAHDEFYSVLETTPDLSTAVQMAHQLKRNRLVVRVSPGADLETAEGP